MATVAPTQSNSLVQLRAFLLEVLPDGVAVVTGQINRVPEPKGKNFVVMIPLRQERLSTNVDSYSDAAFTGSIAGATMTITAVDDRFPDGRIGVGSKISGAGVAVGTKVTAIGVAPDGQVGTYTVSPGAQTVPSETLSAGAKQAMQPMKVAIELAFHTEDLSAADLAATVSTLLRDEYGVNQFANQSPNYGVVPLYADDPAQRPFLNAEQQLEFRWTVDALLQANVVVSVQQQFADSVDLTTVSVDAVYPPEPSLAFDQQGNSQYIPII